MGERGDRADSPERRWWPIGLGVWFVGSLANVDDGYPGYSGYDGPTYTLYWSCTLRGGVAYRFPDGFYKKLVDAGKAFPGPQLCVQRCFYACTLADTSPRPLIVKGTHYTPGVLESSREKWFIKVCPLTDAIVEEFGL